MNRRTFLQQLLASTAILALPESSVASVIEKSRDLGTIASFSIPSNVRFLTFKAWGQRVSFVGTGP